MQEQHDIPISRDEVIENLRAARAELDASIEGLSPEILDGPTRDGGWTIKDHLAHVAEWQRRGLGVIAGKPPWEGLRIERETWDQLDGVDDINEILFQRHRNTPLETVLEDFQETGKQVRLTVESMTEADLQRELPEEISPRYRRVVDIVNYNFARHDRSHIDDIRGIAGRG